MTDVIYILSNNLELSENVYQKILVEGDFLDVLIAARNLVHQGYGLISHPLGASSRMMLSPYRSLLIKKGEGAVCQKSLEVIESSIIQLKNVTQLRRRDVGHSKDYAMIDQILLQEAIEEHARLHISA